MFWLGLAVGFVVAIVVVLAVLWYSAMLAVANRPLMPSDETFDRGGVVPASAAPIRLHNDQVLTRDQIDVDRLERDRAAAGRREA